MDNKVDNNLHLITQAVDNNNLIDNNEVKTVNNEVHKTPRQSTNGQILQC